MKTFLLAALLSAATRAAAAPAHAHAELIAESVSLAPGGTVTVGLRLTMDPGWHTYWSDPGESGLATAVKWILPRGFTASPLRWPYPERFASAHSVGLGYEGRAVLLTEVSAPAAARGGDDKAFLAEVSWLECREVCVPGRATVSLRMPVHAGVQRDSADAPAIAAARRRVPLPFGEGATRAWKARAARGKDGVTLTLTPPRLAPKTDPGEVVFFPHGDGVVDPAAAPRAATAADGTVTVALSASARPAKAAGAGPLSGVVVFPARGQAFELSVPVAPAE